MNFYSRFWGAFGIPLMAAGMYILMLLIPRVDPKRENYSRFRGAYFSIKLGLTAFFTLLYVIILANSLGYPVPVDRAVVTLVGLLFTVIGNFMGQLKHNYFVGIKTPWTLASEEVWNKTHRFGSRVWVASGLATALTGLTVGGQKGFVVVVAAIAAAVVVPVAYAYFLYRRNHQA